MSSFIYVCHQNDTFTSVKQSYSILIKLSDLCEQVYVVYLHAYTYIYTGSQRNMEKLWDLKMAMIHAPTVHSYLLILQNLEALISSQTILLHKTNPRRYTVFLLSDWWFIYIFQIFTSILWQLFHQIVLPKFLLSVLLNALPPVCMSCTSGISIVFYCSHSKLRNAPTYRKFEWLVYRIL